METQVPESFPFFVNAFLFFLGLLTAFFFSGIHRIFSEEKKLEERKKVLWVEYTVATLVALCVVWGAVKIAHDEEFMLVYGARPIFLIIGYILVYPALYLKHRFFLRNGSA